MLGAKYIPKSEDIKGTEVFVCFKILIKFILFIKYDHNMHSY